MIELHGEITEEDYLHAQRLRITPRQWYLIVAYILVVLVGVVALTWMLEPSWKKRTTTIVLVVIVSLVSVPRAVRWRCRQIYRGQPGLRGLHHVKCSESGSEWESAHGSGRTDWSIYVKWRESPRMFILYQSSNLISIIPKHWFGADEQAIDQFRELLNAKSIPCVDDPSRHRRPTNRGQ